MGRFRAIPPTLDHPGPLARMAPARRGRRQSIRPRRRFVVAPARAEGVTGWASPTDTRPGLVCRFGRHDSTSLHPFAPPALPGFVATMDALTPGRSVTPFPGEPGSRLCRHPGLSASRARSSEPPVSNHLTAPIVAFSPNPSARWAPRWERVRVSSSPSRLTGQPGRIEFVILRATRSPPVAPHLASRRRSYVQLQAGVGMPEEDLHLSGRTRLRTHQVGLSSPTPTCPVVGDRAGGSGVGAPSYKKTRPGPL
jgi:hypothetical protein